MSFLILIKAIAFGSLFGIGITFLFHCLIFAIALINIQLINLTNNPFNNSRVDVYKGGNNRDNVNDKRNITNYGKSLIYSYCDTWWGWAFRRFSHVKVTDATNSDRGAKSANSVTYQEVIKESHCKGFNFLKIKLHTPTLPQEKDK